MNALISGFLLGLSLICAIGAQNAFVLRQGIFRQHVLAVCICCALSDAVLIAAGTAGWGTFLGASSWLARAMTVAGGVYLALFALKSFWAALTSSQALELTSSNPRSLAKTVAACLALTWLNPHVYLDTVVLLGTVSLNFGSARAAFAVGAMAASVLFFFALGFGARLIAPLFARPAAWKTLDALIGVVMAFLSIKLLATALQ